ncbi:MAG: hypothetical protein ACNYPD_04820 [Candidatus Halichondribacter symbioticus]
MTTKTLASALIITALTACTIEPPEQTMARFIEQCAIYGYAENTPEITLCAENERRLEYKQTLDRLNALSHTRINTTCATIGNTADCAGF